MLQSYALLHCRYQHLDNFFYVEPCKFDAIQTLGSLQFSQSGVVIPQSDIPDDKVNSFPSIIIIQTILGNYPLV